MPDNIVVPPTLLDKVIQFVDIASLTAKRALDEVEVHRAAQTKAASLREPLLKHLIDSGLVQAHNKQACESMLAGHAETLQLLKAAADKINEINATTKTASTNGVGVDADKSGVPTSNGVMTIKKAGEYNSLEGVVGERNSYVKESDRALLALIGK
jgi:hypothetical protein